MRLVLFLYCGLFIIPLAACTKEPTPAIDEYHVYDYEAYALTPATYNDIELTINDIMIINGERIDLSELTFHIMRRVQNIENLPFDNSYAKTIWEVLDVMSDEDLDRRFPDGGGSGTAFERVKAESLYLRLTSWTIPHYAASRGILIADEQRNYIYNSAIEWTAHVTHFNGYAPSQRRVDDFISSQTVRYLEDRLWREMQREIRANPTLRQQLDDAFAARYAAGDFDNTNPMFFDNIFRRDAISHFLQKWRNTANIQFNQIAFDSITLCLIHEMISEEQS